MYPAKRIAFLIVIFFAGINTSHAQLWRYIGDTPEKEKAFEKYLNKEACSVVTKKTIAYGDTFSYDIRTYAIRSFDNQRAKISLWEKPFSDRVFHIDCGADHLVINVFMGWPVCTD